MTTGEGGEGLATLTTAQLVTLARAIRKGIVRCPLDAAELAAAEVGGAAASAGFLFGHAEAATLAIIEAVLAERRGTRAPTVDLVWTGPEVAGSGARDTAVVVRELFASARKSVLVAGFSFDHGADIFAPLHAVMRDHAVEASIYLDIPRAPAGTPDLAEYARRAVDRFLMVNWPFGAPIPAIYYDPRTITPDSLASMHAKCIVVDEERALVTSANFTNRGQQRNIEVGVVIDAPDVATDLVAQLRKAVFVGSQRAR